MEKILARTATDSYFRAAKALEFGLADRVITSFQDEKGRIPNVF